MDQNAACTDHRFAASVNGKYSVPIDLNSVDNVHVTYVSPFGDPATDHDSNPDVLCMSREHSANSVLDTLDEFHIAATAAIDAGAAQPAFFLSRQLAELSLKALHPQYVRSRKLRRNHVLADFLDVLETEGDELLDADSERQDIVAFIRDLGRHDKYGDQGRYPLTNDGTPSLATVCCADRVILMREVGRLHHYVTTRLAGDSRVHSIMVTMHEFDFGE